MPIEPYDPGRDVSGVGLLARKQGSDAAAADGDGVVFERHAGRHDRDDPAGLDEKIDRVRRCRDHAANCTCSRRPAPAGARLPRLPARTGKTAFSLTDQRER